MAGANFQSTVRTIQGFGVVGDIYSNSPLRVVTGTLAGAADVGRMLFTVAGVADPGGTGQNSLLQVAQLAGAVDTSRLFGVLVNSKEYVLNGDGTSPLNPSLTVHAGVVVDAVQEGEVVISLPAGPYVPGWSVLIKSADGTFDAVAPGTTPIPAGYQNGYGIITRLIPNANPGPQLAVVHFNLPPYAVIA